MSADRPDGRPSLTVVIATYNAESLLPIQLEAVASQAYDGPMEVIVSDNGSNDGTREAALRFVNRIPNLTLVDSTGVRGPSHARNVGASYASGDVLLFVDQDDEMAPGYIDAMMRALVDRPFVAARVDHAALNDRRTSRGRRPWQSNGLMDGRGFLPCASGCTLGMRREVFVQVGGFDEQFLFAQDIDLCWRIQLAGYELSFVPDAVLRYRYRPSLRDHLRQEWNWGTDDVRLYRRFGPYGMTDVTAGFGGEGRRGFAVRLAAARSRSDAVLWFSDLSRRLGRRSAAQLRRCSADDGWAYPAEFAPIDHRDRSSARADQTPAATVVLSTYNGGTQLGRQLDALARQDMAEPWEIIISDNGSTDDTVLIASHYSERLPNLRVLDASSRPGVGHARNAATSRARGEAILYLDQDDEVDGAYLRIMTAALREHALVGAAVDHDSLNPRTVGSRARWQQKGLMPGWGFLPCVSGCSMGVRRDVWEAVGGFDEEMLYAQDIDFSWKVQLAGYDAAFVPGAVLRYQYRESMWTYFQQERHWGTDDIALYRRYGSLGMPRITPGFGHGTKVNFVLRILNARDRAGATSWVAELGRRLGRVEGSRRLETEVGESEQIPEPHGLAS